VRKTNEDRSLAALGEGTETGPRLSGKSKKNNRRAGKSDGKPKKLSGIPNLSGSQSRKRWPGPCAAREPEPRQQLLGTETEDLSGGAESKTSDKNRPARREKLRTEILDLTTVSKARYENLSGNQKFCDFPSGRTEESPRGNSRARDETRGKSSVGNENR
jgi:hypothetical protein